MGSKRRAAAVAADSIPQRGSLCADFAHLSSLTAMISDTVAVGVLTFLGTGTATAAGLWQWQRAQAREARAQFRTQRVEALREVWEALSDLEEAQRTSLTGGPAVADPRLTQVNLLLLRRSPFLRPDEQEWAQAFAQHVTEIDTLIRAQALDGQPDPEWWHTTAQGPRSMGVLATAAGELQLLRRKLGKRYAAVVRGDSD
ncbi:hypothetical protein H181DRAFT_02899 [Streptomyces sp. WMMB 714]|nr:hypothetical protein H181DRAFT_02899 [Streptomyces sp. WMMB 714]